jgi:hypothetical protein
MMSWLDEHPDPVGATVNDLRNDVAALFELHAAGKGDELRGHLAGIYEASIRLGDLLWFFRGEFASAPVQQQTERRVA